MDFKNIDKKYRPIPFWSWNEKLSVEETKRQVKLMDEAGIGGYFMHARGGLLTEYMGDEWFDNVFAACEEGESRGMYSWAYDENGWPSGFGGGKVNGLGVDYQQKAIHVKKVGEGEPLPENTVTVKDGYAYYFVVNPFYVDTLDKKVIKKFIDEIYDKYREKCGDKITGFFTDEPQILRTNGFPWSFILEETFKERFGYSLVENLDSLFFDTEKSDTVRVNYWELVTDLFSESFFKQIYDYCDAHGYKLTGHLVLEEGIWSALCSNGAVMPHYEYFHIPGMDHLGRNINDASTARQLGSAAAQLGKKQVLSETFALSGHNVSHGELRRIYEWQMVKGVNLLCTHLEGYSNRGIRKRDYPPAMYYQQPWWDDMKIFFDSMSRIGMLLSEGEIVCDTLLMHNQTDAWRLYDGREFSNKTVDEIMSYDRALRDSARILDDKHILFHFGDETLIKRHGRVEGDRFIIGNMSYKTVVVPKHIKFLPYTEELLEKFQANGGVITTAKEIRPSNVTAVNRLSYTMRRFDDFDMHYFVNSDPTPITADIAVGNMIMDIETGELSAFSGSHTFEPFSSIVLIDYRKPRESFSVKPLGEQLSLLGEWSIKSSTMNSLTLDTCDYYFDGELVEKSGYVLNILPRINELRRPVKLRQTYRFVCEDVPSKIYLAIENPENFTATVNGENVDMKDEGHFRDISFRLVSISGKVKKGENVIELYSTVVQREETYRHLDSSWTFESMKNSLSYDMEIEPVYIVGDFGVRLPEISEELELSAYRISDVPTIVSSPKTVDVSALEKSGYPEFAGTLTLVKKINVSNTDKYVNLKGKAINSVHLSINGKEVATRIFEPYRVDVSEYLREGENEFEIKIINNLRNMMGPHHLAAGESFSVGPGNFYKESNVFSHDPGAKESCHDVRPFWNADVCLMHFGLED